MKKGLRWIISGLVLASTFTVAACGGEEVEEHKHTYAATWTSNEAGHWYAATCEHTDQMANMATHEDEDNDGVCDVCGYGEDHEHTWDTENWTSDTTSHWHAVSCGHSVEVKDKAAHVDENDDGVCDVCEGLTYDETHVHEYAAEYQADLTHHWNLGACETTDGKTCHTGVIGNKEKHTDDDKDGVCDVCENKTYDETVHTHAAASGAAWVYDNANHWKVCAEHAGVKVEVASHKDADNNKICDECGFDYNHTHTYNTSVWTADTSDHWHAVTCGCSIAVVDKAAHTDANYDGVCDVCLNNTFAASHTHAAASGAAWEKDATGHWMVCAEHAGVKVNVGNHVDANNDGICETCEYDVHAGAGHSFASVYSYDDTNHWFASSCGHNVKKGEEAHVDENNDKECDVCGRVDGTHEHTYDTSAWKQSATTHYYEATCGCSLKALEEDHKDNNNDGICDVCEYVLYAEDHVHADNATAEWEKDADNHWKRCTAHSGVIVLEAAHVDENDDGICDVCTYADAEHEHTYVNEWSYDETNHWHVGECHSGVTDTAEAHKDENNNGVCDVCEWNYNHTHEYEAEYTTDENQHWYVVTCGHDVEVREDHYDVDDDGICDACELQLYAEGHVHTAAEDAEIYSDATYHWYVCEEHSGVKVNVEAHVDENGDIACDVCGMHVLASIIDYIDSGIAEMVNMGQVSVVTPYGNTDLFYEIGVDYFHTYDWAGVESEFFYTTANGDIFVIENSPYDGLRKPYREDYTLDNLNGYEITLADYATIVGYGVEDMIVKLYNEAVANGSLAMNFTPIYNWNEELVGYEYGFSGTHEGNYGYVYNFNVTFTGSEGGFVETFTLEVDPESEYQEGVRYEFVQKAGIRSAVCPYSAADFIPASFDILNGEGVTVNDGDTIQMTMGVEASWNPLYWNIVNIAPDTANLNFDTFTITCVDSEGNDAEGMINIYPEGDSLSISHGYSPKAGSYTVTMSWTNVSYTLTFVLNLPEVTEISAKVYNTDEEYWSNTSFVEVFTGSAVQFRSEVNEYANNAYTASVTSENAASAELDSEEVPATEWTAGYTKYTFTATVAGVYEVTLVSAENEEVSCVLTITVNTPPTPAEILSGYKGYFDSYDGTGFGVQFTPVSEGALTGSAIIDKFDIDDPYSWNPSIAYSSEQVTYSYDEETGVITLTHVEGDELGVSLEIRDSVLWIVGELMATWDTEFKAADTIRPEIPEQTETVSPEEAILGNWENGNGLYMAFGDDGTGYIADNWNWPGSMNGILFSYSIRDFYGTLMVDIEIIQTKGEFTLGTYPIQSSDNFATINVPLEGNEMSTFTKSLM